MRIFLFTEHYPTAYKPYYDTQFADLLETGHEITIFAGGKFDHELSRKVVRYGLGERTRYFPTTLRRVPRQLPGALLEGLTRPARLRQALEAVRSEAPTLKARLVHVLRALSVSRETPDLCLLHGLLSAQMLPWLKRIFPVTPVAMYYHGGEVPLVPRLSKVAARRAFASVDLVLTNTEASRRQAIERGCPEARVEVLPVGFAIGEYRPDGRTYRPQEKLRLFSAGRLSEEKGFLVALQAIRQLVERGLRNLSYVVAGDGYLRKPMEAYIADHGLQPYVRLLGTVPAEGVVQAMKEADVLLLPSVPFGTWVETQACAVQEAMLMKCIAITSRIGGVPESIPPAMQPFCVTPGDVSALTGAIARAYALSVDELRTLGETCREFVVQRYDIRDLNRRMIERMSRIPAARSTRAPRPSPGGRPGTEAPRENRSTATVTWPRAGT